MNNTIHKFEQNGIYIVMDINSGGVHVVDKIAYEMLNFVVPPMEKEMPLELADKMVGYDKEEILECYQELLSLYEADCLFSTDTEYQKYAELSLNAPIKAMCLHVSHDCNLRCKYCFASTGDFGMARLLMTPETGKKAIDFLVAKSIGRENLEIDFFGGEPLMAWETVVETVKYARSIEKDVHKNFRFTITTNGVALDDEKIDFINREMSNCVLSLDGRPEVNDRLRVTPNDKGSYALIVPKFQKLISGRVNPSRTDYYIRGTFTKFNKDFVSDVLHIRDLGFDQISVEPVVTDPSMPYAITKEDLPEIFLQYDKLYTIMRDEYDKKKEDDSFKPMNFFHFMVDLNQGPCAVKRLRGCGCGNEYVAVTPDGDVYPCHQFVGIDKWKMGTIFDGVIDKDIKEYFAKTHIFTKQGCKDCFARFYCSGGCNANSYLYEGDVRIPHTLACELQKKRTECAIALQAYKLEART